MYYGLNEWRRNLTHSHRAFRWREISRSPSSTRLTTSHAPRGKTTSIAALPRPSKRAPWAKAVMARPYLMRCRLHRDLPAKPDEDPEENELAAGVLSWAREDAQPSSWSENGSSGEQEEDSYGWGEARRWSRAVGRRVPSSGGINLARTTSRRQNSSSVTADRLVKLTRERTAIAARRSNRTLILH
eukprot:scaffold284629_cov36-Tisochrysis_lutea.AAC.5